jgi:hypothetical protein
MEWFAIAFVFVSVIGSLAMLGYIVFQGYKKRIAEIKALANEFKLQYFPKGDASIGPLLSNIEFFQCRDSPKISHLVKGQVKRNGKSVTVAIFDYQYIVDDRAPGTSDPDNITCVTLTALVFYNEALNLPGFRLSLEHRKDKIIDDRSFEDISFSEFPTFSKRYRLHGAMLDQIRAIFQPNIIKFYERDTIYTEANGSYILMCPMNAQPNIHRTTHKIAEKKDAIPRWLSAPEMKSYLEKGLSLLSIFEHNQTQAQNNV